METENKKITFDEIQEKMKKADSIKTEIDDEAKNVNTLVELKKRIDLGDVDLVIGDKFRNNGYGIMNSVTFNNKKYSVYFINMIDEVIKDKENWIASLQNDLNNL